MWNELESYKNHFLQLYEPQMKIGTVNQLVNEEFSRRQTNRTLCKFPSNRNCDRSTYFRDHAEVAYGFIAMEKLTHDICSDDALEKWRSINSLSKLMLNPWQAHRAIREMDIVRKTQNIFLRMQHNYHREFYEEKLRCLKIFYIISNYLVGAREIVRRKNLLNEFYRIILMKFKGVDLATKILCKLTEKPEVLQYMNENTPAFNKVTAIFKDDLCTPVYPNSLWQHLGHFLEIDPEVALEKGFFELLHRRIVKRRLFYHQLCMQCFALLLRCEEGQRRFDKVDGVKLIYDILSAMPSEGLDTYEYVVHALLQGMVSKHALWRCREFTNFPDILIDLAKDPPNERQQVYCLKALRLMGAMPCVKAYMREVCLRGLLSMKCLDECSHCLRDQLVEWLNAEIYEYAELL